MRYQYNGFIPQNIAPKGATEIGVYDSTGKRVCSVPLGGLTPVTKTKRYSFGVVSDLHITEAPGQTSTYLDNALSYFEEQGCAFCAHGGDMTNIGFWSASSTEIYFGQFAEYKRICDMHPNLPVYGITGNHESYNKPITQNLPELTDYTGHGLYYTVQHDNDVFIFIGQPASYETISKVELQWLYEILEANRNTMCHIFVHVFPPNDSGNTHQCYSATFGGYLNSVKNLLSHYRNTILYHGHSHIKFECQEMDDATNYTRKNGFHSVHIPSVGECRNVVLQDDGSYKRVNDYAYSQGYIVEVYDDCIVFNGIEFNSGKPVPTGVFKLDATIQNIPAGTFTDSSGNIVP